MIEERLQTNVIELHLLMATLWKASQQGLDQWLSDHGIELSRLQVGLLRMLTQEGSQTISELSRKFGVDPSTLVPTVDGLERKGLVIRERDPNDRRRVPLSPTEAGRALMAELPPIAPNDPIVKALDAIGPEAVRQLLLLLCELAHHLPNSEEATEGMFSRLHTFKVKDEHIICKPRNR